MIAALIVAAGRGLRVGGDVPKQFRQLAGMPVLSHTINAFLSHDQIDTVMVVLNLDDIDLFNERVRPHLVSGEVSIAQGGAERCASVHNGLLALGEGHPDYVLIHDGARPLIDRKTISAVIGAMRPAKGAAPAIELSDTLWQSDGEVVTGSPDRASLCRAQTPQGFPFAAILKAHQDDGANRTDDVQVAIHAGLDVAIVPGDERNLKITTEQDFLRAEQILGQGMNTRIGNGFDVHAFGPGTEVTLLGVNIPHTQALSGHSDADVAMHAITDAIYGALAQGDIGTWFPPSDAQWKGAASDIFLRHACNLAQELGFRLVNLDCTIICENPKIGPHRAAMRARMAQITGLAKDRISVKATTSEGLGFTGRKEGIAAMATANLGTL